jgi:anti-anti-sigma regulatory factor
MASARRRADGPPVVVLGDGGPQAAREFHDALTAATRSPQGVIADLTAVSAIDGGILSTLCAAADVFRGRRCAVVASPAVVEALAEWRFDTVFELFTDRDAATRAPA